MGLHRDLLGIVCVFILDFFKRARLVVFGHCVALKICASRSTPLCEILALLTNGAYAFSVSFVGFLSLYLNNLEEPDVLFCSMVLHLENSKKHDVKTISTQSVSIISR